MKQIGQVFARLFTIAPATPEGREERERRAIHREWDKQRARAMSPSERDEIDTIFSRAL